MSFAVFLLAGIFKPMGIEIIANNNNKNHSSHMELEQKNKSNETFINI